ncbi:MAG: AbrB/MazE/SpoVT family DNA-binding domain-containing protein [Alphaproteobacteria bacterium]|nr:AbrB/MazE/SpoVT family DNA-binding domain-containing protein [Alphaproteobacteria bacterium]
MRVNLVQIGNSRGIRIPKAILEQCGFGHEAEMEVKRGTIVISPVSAPRDGWREAIEENEEALQEGWEW